MSTQNRTGGGGSRIQSKKSNSNGGEIGSKKTDVKAADKEKSQPKPTAEQIRIAQITDCRSEDPKMREKVATLIEMTQRSEEEVCCALYECDNNLEKAVVFLLETLPVGAFETSSKKKKNRTTNATPDGTADGEWSETNNNTNNNNAENNNNRDRSRNRATIRGGRGGSDSRGWRGREARENERNASDSKGGDGGWRGGRGRGGSRGGYGGRGGRGGRAGPRGMGSRDSGRNYSRQNQDTQEVDTWDNAIATNAEQMKQQDAFSDAWGDWDNEEYVGSLKDTKVFTPSNLQTQNMSVTSDLSAPPGLEQHMVNASHITADDLVQQYSTSYSTTVVSSTTTAPAAVNSVQFADIHSAAANAASQHLRLGLDTQQINASSTLSAEQSQYFNSLPSQGSNQQTNVNSYQNTSVQYPTSYVSNNVFGDQNVTSQPSVRRARAKVPPPSKIPASAVEMPGDTLNNIGYLDVQFGGLDFATEESFDTLTEKFNATTIDGQQNVQSQEVSGDYQSKSSSQQSSLPSALQTSQMIPNSDTLSSSQTDPLSSSYSQRATSNVSQQNTGVSSSINASGNNALDQLSKSDPYNQTNASSTTGYQNSYNSTSTTNKSASYQSSGSTQGYNSSNYSTNSQVKVSSGGNSFQPSSNSAYNTYNQNSVSSYQQQNNTSANSSSSSAAVNASSATNSGSATQNIPVGGSNSAVNNSGSNTNAAGYLSNQYQSNQTSSAFPSQQSTGYQNSQNVYGTTGLTNNTGFSGSTNTSSSQYSNFNSSKLKETSTSASTHFESVSNVTSSSATSTVSSVSSSSVTTNSMSSPSLGLANTKVTNSTAKSTAGGILPNIQMVSQYIQTGLPYYQQPLYSYEDIQMMQQRMPHVTQYYDINYPPTSLGAAGVRDANLGSVAYSTMTDGRFTRTDNNSSPVSSTMSQQAGSGGPMLNVPYAYFYGGNMMPGGFQYGTPAIYPQQMPTANATSGGQFPKPSYNSGYGSTSYDALSQATQDYSKGAYAGSGVSQQSKAQAVTNQPQAASASDITSSMYGKSHVALNKVNSYEKQSFHSATPPPFNLTGTQTAAGTSAQPYGMYIQPMPAAHHNMNIHQPIHQHLKFTNNNFEENNSFEKRDYVENGFSNNKESEENSFRSFQESESSNYFHDKQTVEEVEINSWWYMNDVDVSELLTIFHISKEYTMWSTRDT